MLWFGEGNDMSVILLGGFWEPMASFEEMIHIPKRLLEGSGDLVSRL